MKHQDKDCDGQFIPVEWVEDWYGPTAIHAEKYKAVKVTRLMCSECGVEKEL